MKFFEETVGSERLFEGKIINLRRDTVKLVNGQSAIREVVEHSGGVCVLPLMDDGNVIFVRQFRYPYGCELLELPAGKLEKGEDPREAGLRELSEETGAQCSTFTSLGQVYPTVAYDTEIIYLYLAEGLTFHEQHLDEDEFVEVVKIPLKEAIQMVMDGRIKDSKTQIALLKVGMAKG